MGAGSVSTTTGYNYWGSFALCLGVGPASRLLAIRNGETVIWEGPVDVGSADGDGKTTLTTDLGVIDFYWGLADQEINGLLAALEIDLGAGAEVVLAPAYRRTIYAVCQDIAFGQQVTPPTLLFDLDREVEVLEISSHEIDGDAVIPEVVYDWLTNPFHGAGLDPEVVDAASFVAAAERVIEEGLGASPDMDVVESARETIGRLLSHVDGHLYFDVGKIKCRLIRPGEVEEPPVISEVDMIDEPEPQNEQYDTTWNQTVVTFRDRENKWEEAAEAWDDPANAGIVGRHVTREHNFPWVTNRAMAARLARRIGVAGGLPAMFWRVQLKPAWRSLKPGDVVRLDYAPLGIEGRLARVREVRRGGPNSPEVEVRLVEEAARDEAEDYLPTGDYGPIPGVVDSEGSGEFAIAPTTPRLSWLPEALKDGKLDGLLVAMRRTDGTVLRAKLWWTWDPGAMEYAPLDETASFPAAARLLAWHQVRGTNWLLRVEMESNFDRAWLQSLVQEGREVYCVAAARLWKTAGVAKDEHQVMAGWLRVVAGGRFTPLGGNRYDVEVVGGGFGTDDLAHEGLATDGVYPAEFIYFGRREDFLIHTTDAIVFDRDEPNSLDDTGRERHFKAALRNIKREQALSDLDAVVFDRADAAMCPDGSYSTEWGPAVLTAYELLDEAAGSEALLDEAPGYSTLEDLDAALGAVFDGVETGTQAFLAASVDDVLGVMIDDNQAFYAP